MAGGEGFIGYLNTLTDTLMSMFTTPTPAGAVKVRLNVNSSHAAYGRLTIGQILIVDHLTGGRWISSGIATQIPDEPESVFKAVTLSDLGETVKPKRGRRKKSEEG